MKRSRPDARDQAKRAALNALKRARRAAALSGAKLSDWEGDFLGSVEDRIKTYGRAFADPEKGVPGESLSTLQHVKLREIAVKAKGGGKPVARTPFSAKRGLRQRSLGRPGR
jgi:hypothetical protein